MGVDRFGTWAKNFPLRASRADFIKKRPEIFDAPPKTDILNNLQTTSHESQKVEMSCNGSFDEACAR